MGHAHGHAHVTRQSSAFLVFGASCRYKPRPITRIATSLDLPLAAQVE